MARVLVVAWPSEHCTQMLAAFDADGHEVETDIPKDSAVAHAKVQLPDVVCIDLGDQPNFGREVARVLAKTKATRDIPMVLYGVDAATEPRARTAAPRAVVIAPRDPGLVRQAVRKALSFQIRDYGDDDEV